MASYVTLAVFYFNLIQANHNENNSSKNIQGFRYLKSIVMNKKEKFY